MEPMGSGWDEALLPSGDRAAAELAVAAVVAESS
jgi:hypothetical protein